MLRKNVHTTMLIYRTRNVYMRHQPHNLALVRNGEPLASVPNINPDLYHALPSITLNIFYHGRFPASLVLVGCPEERLLLLCQRAQLFLCQFACQQLLFL